MSKEKSVASDSGKQLPEITQRLKSENDLKVQEPLPKSPPEQLQPSDFPKYRSYRFWNLICIFVITLILVPHNFQVAKVGSNVLISVLTFIITVWIYSQYIVELYAIYLKNLSAANIALQMMGFNAFFLLLATLYSAYSLFTSRLNPSLPPSDSSSTGLALLKVSVVALSLISVTHIFITFWGALKVRDALIKRQVSLEKAKI